MVYAGSDAAGSSSAAAPGCGHPFCIDCMRQYVSAGVHSSTFPVRCPSPGCRQTVAHHDVMRLLRDSPADLERYTRLEVESSIHPSQRVYCPHKDCSTLFMRPEEGEPEGPTACPACTRTLCVKCLIPGWHERGVYPRAQSPLVTNRKQARSRGGGLRQGHRLEQGHPLRSKEGFHCTKVAVVLSKCNRQEDVN
ncbi:hypothetical protein FOA52_003248 [Chlamydomonas sp. UWO 241]|nr:hypothetical protein FOA52_003248 [Chlamydomonas sp. UWO 241]